MTDLDPVWCLLAGIALTLAVCAVVWFVGRRANRTEAPGFVQGSNVVPLARREGVRVMPQQRRWEA